MNDLTKLSNEQLGDFIQISLIHGTNTQFSYELLHEVASRLKHTDEIIKAGISNGIHDTLTKQSTAFKFRLEDVVQTLDEALAPAISEDNNETVELLTIDVSSYEAMDKAVKEAFEEEPVEEAPVKKEPKKKEKPTVKESLTVEPAPVVEESIPSANELIITGKMLKDRAMEMRQSNVISADSIRGKLTEFGATSILTLDAKYHVDFYNFLESYNV
jgi:hypothetical protein